MEKEIKKNEKKLKKIINAKKVKFDINKVNKELPKFNSLTTKNAHLKEKGLLRPKSSKFAANINNYRFLYDPTNKESGDYTKWVLNLRILDDLKKINKKLLGEPSFYQNDLDKFMKKRKRNRLVKSKSVFEFNTLSNFSQYKHLFRRNDGNHGTFLTGPLLNYKLNLRNDSQSLSLPSKWISNTNSSNDRYYYSCSNFYTDKINGKLTDKNIMRPYKMQFSKTEYNGHKLWVKIAKRDEKKAYEVMGEHLALKPYNDKYIEKNVYKIKELLKDIEKSQARTWYHIKLRNYNNEKDDKFMINKKKWKNW